MDARCGTFLSKATTGSMSFDTGLGTITPSKTCLYFLVGPPASAGALHDNIDCGHGFCDHSLNQYGAGAYLPWDSDYKGHRIDYVNDFSTSQAIYVVNDPQPAAATILIAATVTAINSNGTVTLNFTTVDGGGIQRTIAFMAVTGVSSACGSLDWTSGTVTTNVGFTPCWVSTISRAGITVMSAAHTVNYSRTDLTTYPAPYSGTPFLVGTCGNVMAWESVTGGGSETGTQTQAYWEDRFASPVYEALMRPDPGADPAFGSSAEKYDLLQCIIVANGFTIDKLLTYGLGRTDLGIGYMAVLPDDASILSSRSSTYGASETDSDLPISYLTAKAVLLASATWAEGDQLRLANFGFADLHGNQVCLSVAARDTGPANSSALGDGTMNNQSVPVGCAIFADRVQEIFHPTYTINQGTGLSPFEHAKCVLNVADPDNIAWAFTPNPSSWPGPGVVVIGPLKAAAPAFLGQIYRVLRS